MSPFDPIYKLIRPDQGHATVLIVELDSIICDPLIGLLTKHERARCHRYHRQTDRRAVAVMRGLWRLGAGALTEAHPTQVPIDRDQFGRPSVSNADRISFDINVSRSSTCCGLIISSDGRCGIDIERVNPQVVTQDLVEMLGADVAESAKLIQDAGSFFTLWTQFEAALKADGRGLSGGLQAARRVGGKVPESPKMTIESNSWTIGAIQMPLGFVGSYALDHERTRVSQIPIEEIEGVWSQRILCAHGD